MAFSTIWLIKSKLLYIRTEGRCKCKGAASYERNAKAEKLIHTAYLITNWEGGRYRTCRFGVRLYIFPSSLRLPPLPSRLPPELSVVCHGYRRRRPINEILFGEPEGLYVYVSY